MPCDRCTQTCRQGRDCPEGKPVDAPPWLVIVLVAGVLAWGGWIVLAVQAVFGGGA